MNNKKRRNLIRIVAELTIMHYMDTGPDVRNVLYLVSVKLNDKLYHYG